MLHTLQRSTQPKKKKGEKHTQHSLFAYKIHSLVGFTTIINNIIPGGCFWKAFACAFALILVYLRARFAGKWDAHFAKRSASNATSVACGCKTYPARVNEIRSSQMYVGNSAHKRIADGHQVTKLDELSLSWRFSGINGIETRANSNHVHIG